MPGGCLAVASSHCPVITLHHTGNAGQLLYNLILSRQNATGTADAWPTIRSATTRRRLKGNGETVPPVAALPWRFVRGTYKQTEKAKVNTAPKEKP